MPGCNSVMLFLPCSSCFGSTSASPRYIPSDKQYLPLTLEVCPIDVVSRQLLLVLGFVRTNPAAAIPDRPAVSAADARRLGLGHCAGGRSAQCVGSSLGRGELINKSRDGFIRVAT